MKRKKGFSLIEVMMYMTLLSFVSLMVMQHVMKSMAHLTRVRTRGNTINTLNQVASLIVRDIQAASALRDSWKKILPDSCIFHNDGYDCGWLLSKGNLYRIKGLYDAQTDCWKKKKKQRVLLDVDTVEFTVTSDEKRVHSVKVILSAKIPGGIYTTKQYATPRSMVEL